MSGKRMHSGFISPVFAVLLAAAVLCYVLFFPPITGVADNGSYSSVIYPEGLYQLDDNSDDLDQGYFISDYGIMQYFNEYTSGTHTSQTLFIQAAIGLDQLFTGNDSVFDIRFLGGLIVLYFLAALYFFTTAVSSRLSVVGALTAALICVVIFCDISYTAFFNSFYAESLMFVCLLFFIACMLLFSENPRLPGLALAGLLINGFIFIFLNRETALSGIGLGVIGYLMLFKDPKPAVKTTILIGSTLLVCFSVFSVVWFNAAAGKADQYHAMTRGVLITSDNPDDTLTGFDINEQYALLEESTYYDTYPVISPDDQRLTSQFYGQYNTAAVIRYYIAHPDAFFGLLKQVTANMFRFRPNLSSYTYNSGYPPQTLANFPGFFSEFKAGYMPSNIGFLIVWAVLVVVTVSKSRTRQMALLMLILTGFAVFIQPIFRAGDAAFLRSLHLFNIIFDIATVMLLTQIIALIDPKHRKWRSEQ